MSDNRLKLPLRARIVGTLITVGQIFGMVMLPLILWLHVAMTAFGARFSPDAPPEYEDSLLPEILMATPIFLPLYLLAFGLIFGPMIILKRRLRRMEAV